MNVKRYRITDMSKGENKGKHYLSAQLHARRRELSIRKPGIGFGDLLSTTLLLIKRCAHIACCLKFGARKWSTKTKQKNKKTKPEQKIMHENQTHVRIATHQLHWLELNLT